MYNSYSDKDIRLILTLSPCDYAGWSKHLAYAHDADGDVVYIILNWNEESDTFGEVRMTFTQQELVALDKFTYGLEYESIRGINAVFCTDEFCRDLIVTYLRGKDGFDAWIYLGVKAGEHYPVIFEAYLDRDEFGKLGSWLHRAVEMLGWGDKNFLYELTSYHV